MSNAVGNQSSLAEALKIAKNNSNGPGNSQALQTVERASNDIWRRIQAKPATYIMTETEYSVMNYFQERYKHNDLYQKAVARFWKHYNPDSNLGNGGSSSRAGS